MRHPQQVKVCEILDLGYPLDDLKGGEVPKKGEVLLHLYHYMRSGVGNSNVLEAAKVTIKTEKSCWFGSNVAIAPDVTLTRVLELHKLLKFIYPIKLTDLQYSNVGHLDQ